MQIQVEIKKMFIGGKWTDANQTFDVFNPEDNQLLAKVPLASKEDMTEAIGLAEQAFENREFPTHERMRVLHQAASYMKKHKELFATTIASEGSKTINESRSEVERSIQTIEISAEEARRLNGETINFDQNEGSENRVGYQYRFPIGVVGAITPFNDPLNLVAHKVGPAIAAGNAVVVKPASDTPLSALLLAEAFSQAELPAGYLSVITGSGREIGETLITHPSVKMVSFTGGLHAGERIAEQAGIKKLNMELGSNSPVIVLNDANVQDAVQACVSGAFAAAGQNCIGVQRIYVEQDVYDDFLQSFSERTKELRLGFKRDELTDVGPMINESEAARVESWVNEAVAEGASIQVGGRRDGAFYQPTVLTNVSQVAKIAQEEIFGPVVIIHPVDSLTEAIRYANNTNYGLQAGIFTSDIDKAFYTIKHLHVGGVMINDSSDYRIDAMPFGGVKGSGLGREGVKTAIETMTDPKVVCFRLQDRLG
ncbi:aldehyde dehydrogenase family protein [Radiobacillus sp. PE A8.2]|uniref:aldehyde dehydrogenase family protein n=1 Tax=Radiobacillus sp. PE A8.2 TaxID=3380349 RepID=UPI00388DB277